MLREEAGKPSRIFSASWARDEDINRYLKSLPNWLNLQEERTKGKMLVCYGYYYDNLDLKLLMSMYIAIWESQYSHFFVSF